MIHSQVAFVKKWSLRSAQLKVIVLLNLWVCFNVIKIYIYVFVCRYLYLFQYFRLNINKYYFLQCANVSYVNYDSLETCVKTEGPEILAHYGERTHALKGRKYVPTVVVDDVSRTQISFTYNL